MKHFFITLYLLGISLFSSAQQEEKAALLITHYGSSDPQTRALTLDVVTREDKKPFRSLQCAKHTSRRLYEKDLPRRVCTKTALRMHC